MADANGFEAYEALHRDLEALRDNRLPNIERLSGELRAHISEFQGLLDHKKRSNESRKQLSGGSIEVDDIVYAINEDFRQQTIQIAEELDLDELESARLFLLAQDDAQELDRSAIVSAVMRFHKRRQYLLESLRLMFELGEDEDIDTDEAEKMESEGQEDQDDGRSARDELRQLTTAVLNFGDQRIEGPSKYWQKCIAAMQDIEQSLQRVAERTQRASVIGQALSQDEEQIMAYERDTLNTQHESLAAVTAFLTRHGNLRPDDFRSLLAKVKTLDRHDMIMIHYLPVLMCSISQFGSSAASCSEDDSTALHKTILADKDTDRWPLRNFYNAILSWWIVEYKGRFPEPPDADPSIQSADSEAEILTKRLKEGGLLFMLSVAQDVKRSDWHDPAKVGLTTFLLRDTAVLVQDSPRPAAYFQDLLMTQFQSFVDAFVSNMPDTLRLLKFEEDDQRKHMRSRFQNSPAEYQYHLETFLVLIAYAYEDSPESAKSFWTDTEGNLYGFVQWAAKRQTTPRVAAFCEMLRSLSEGSENADSTHQFLLDEGVPIAGKLRRTASLSWNQIFAELDFYSTGIKDRPASLQSSGPPNSQNPLEQTFEPESALMLECYLRLITHLCLGSDAARTWLLSTENPSLSNVLILLCGSNIESRLRACAFTTLASLLVNKTVDVADTMWFKLDHWIAGGLASTSMLPRAAPTTSPPSSSEARIFEMIATGFEEPNAFMQLLNALILPSREEFGLNDSLPFPENLGSPYRLPGIGLYIDFALGTVFADKTSRISDEHQLRLLRLNCLDFICSSLSSFNEDLVIIANKSNLPVEATMRSSSLEAYVRLHPFSRIMEWLFDDKVADALFAAAHQNVDDVNQASSDSPLLLSLVRSIEAMNLIMKLQSTYVDIVRPLIKRLAPNRKPVSHSAIASFEDMVLKHLDLIVDLGLYCGLGHSELTICSLALLEQLASSRKLIISPSASFSKRSDRSKLISALEKDGEGERISRSLAGSMIFDIREYEASPLSSGYIIKTGIIGFLKDCLATLSDRPTIAHLLLGFTCKSNQLEVETDGLFAAGTSLFHAVARLALEYPDFNGEYFVPWASNIKESCTEILRVLWRSPLSTALVMTELRVSEYIFLQAVRQVLVASPTLWDGRPAADPQFLLTDSATALRNFLRQRTAYYDYFARELKVAKAEGMASLRTRLELTLLGSTTFPGEQPAPNPNIFELFDFVEVEFGPEIAMPEMKYFKENDFAVCQTDNDEYGAVYDLARAEQIVLLLRNDFLGKRPQGRELITKESAKQEEKEQEAFDEDVRIALLCLLGQNQRRELVIAQAETLKSWVQLMVVSLSTCEFEGSIKAEFIQHAFQLILPKFERACSEDISAAVQLGGLLNTLLTSANSLTTEAPKQSPSRTLDASNDKEFQVFRAALTGITGHATNIHLRGICYQICSQYLYKADQGSSKTPTRHRHISRNIKLLGDRLVDIVCDDAYAGQASSRISALLFLESLIAVTAQDDARLILGPFERLNFVGVLLDSIKAIPSDLRQTAPAEIPVVLGYHNAFLALLLRISQTRIGATQVLHGGIFQSVRESQIFSADPDVGLEMENPEALKKFFDLMLSVLRIINSVVLKNRNDQTQKLALTFLTENRFSVVAVFKRFAGVGGREVQEGIDLSDLVDNLTVLISEAKFLDFEEETTLKKAALDVFS